MAVAYFVNGHEVTHEAYDRTIELARQRWADGELDTFEPMATGLDMLSPPMMHLKVPGWLPCDCGCGMFAPNGHMEAAHPEDYKHDERA